MAHKIGIVGFGKIARDQHLPALSRDPAFELAAVASTSADAVPGVRRVFRTVEEMLAGAPDLDAVAVCTPPQPRHAIARAALLAGKHVLLEKPPAATLGEVADLDRLAREHGRVLFATWHSRFNAAVAEAKRRLAGQAVAEMDVQWREDVRKWHPGQDWIWQPGGFGVFDPGINALSIVTEILPGPIFLRRCELSVPAGRDAPIAADLEFSSGREGARLRAKFDWRHTEHETWEITLRTEAGTRLALTGGGARLEVDGALAAGGERDEYGGIYARFDELLRAGRSEVDARPFELVADAFMLGRRVEVEAFEG